MEANNLILFSYAMCNLNCIYCTIDKNKYLKEVDDILKDSFNNYEEQYCKRIKKWFTKDSLTNVETWGGEPLWDIERIFPLLDWVIKEYPKFDSFFSSTNLSYDFWVDKLLALLNFFANYKQRNFSISIQLSIDGPKYINDTNRGKGITDKCIENLKKLCDVLFHNRLSENIQLTFFTKPTLNIDNIEKDLQTKEAIVEYYKFFDEVFDLFTPVIRSKNNIYIHASKPNLATPSPVTKTTGIKFANMVKLCREIEKEVSFNHFDTITPFELKDRGKGDFDSKLGAMCGGCGTGVTSIFMMPNDYYLTCHNAFGDLAEGYKKFSTDNDFKEKKINLDGFLSEKTLPFILTEDEYEKYSISQQNIYNPTNTALGCLSVSSVQLLALAGQIDKKYMNQVEAVKAVSFLKNTKIYCIYNNQLMNHSTCVPGSDEYKLFLNGALEYL